MAEAIRPPIPPVVYPTPFPESPAPDPFGPPTDDSPEPDTREPIPKVVYPTPFPEPPVPDPLTPPDDDEDEPDTDLRGAIPNIVYPNPIPPPKPVKGVTVIPQKPPIIILTADNGFSIITNINNNQVSISKSANWDQTGILNRSAPIITYANSGAMEVSITFDLFAQKDVVTEVIDPVRGLISLVFPKFPGVKTPPRCYLTFGGIFKEWLCVCQSVSVTASGETTTWIPGSKTGGAFGAASLPMSASVQTSFLEVDLYNKSSYEWDPQQSSFLGGIPT